MRARRLTAAGMLTAAAFSTTVGGFAITGSLDKAFAASPVSPPVSQPQNPGQSGQGQNPGQSGKGQNAGVSLADLAGGISGSLNGSNFSATNVDGNAAGAAGTETLEESTLNITGFSDSDCPVNALVNLCVDFSGTFTITTSVGTLSGTTTGGVGEDVTESSSGPQLTQVNGELALTVTSGTGQFTGTTGTLDVALQYEGLVNQQGFTGSITAA
jgi:hypothetical protein